MTRTTRAVRMILAVSMVLLLAIPPAAAGADFQARMACVAPGFVDCTIVVAAAAAGCADLGFLVGQVCVGMGFGAVGGASVVALFGGAAFGEVTASDTSEFVGCTWQGASGFCMDGAGDGGFVCPTVTASGAGYLPTTPPGVPRVPVGAPGPFLSVTAIPADCTTGSGCAAVTYANGLVHLVGPTPLTTSVDCLQASGLSPLQAQTVLRSLASSAVEGADLDPEAIMDSDHAQFANLEAYLDAAGAGMDDWANGIVVHDDYGVEFPASWQLSESYA